MEEPDTPSSVGRDWQSEPRVFDLAWVEVRFNQQSRHRYRLRLRTSSKQSNDFIDRLDYEQTDKPKWVTFSPDDLEHLIIEAGLLIGVLPAAWNLCASAPRVRENGRRVHRWRYTRYLKAKRRLERLLRQSSGGTREWYPRVSGIAQPYIRNYLQGLQHAHWKPSLFETLSKRREQPGSTID